MWQLAQLTSPVALSRASKNRRFPSAIRAFCVALSTDFGVSDGAQAIVANARQAAIASCDVLRRFTKSVWHA
ncbi:hypothetical protein [Lysobacter silvisoli]|uniref:hypothetical protein n=1 Tax=Lysobacter silvisoli TaxID=2293254 RepID=UPI001E3ACC84|nr:hypothetical protein [Lysobacter silvisoli]